MPECKMQSGAELPGHSALFILHSALRSWAREDLRLQGSQTLDLWGLLFPPNHSPKNIEMKTGASSRCCPDRNSLQKKSAGCCVEAKTVAVSGAAPDTAGL